MWSGRVRRCPHSHSWAKDRMNTNRNAVAGRFLQWVKGSLRRAAAGSHPPDVGHRVLGADGVEQPDLVGIPEPGQHNTCHQHVLLHYCHPRHDQDDHFCRVGRQLRLRCGVCQEQRHHAGMVARGARHDHSPGDVGGLGIGPHSDLHQVLRPDQANTPLASGQRPGTRTIVDTSILCRLMSWRVRSSWRSAPTHWPRWGAGPASRLRGLARPPTRLCADSTDSIGVSVAHTRADNGVRWLSTREGPR